MPGATTYALPSSAECCVARSIARDQAMRMPRLAEIRQLDTLMPSRARV